jgi:hypothetical protein
MTIHWPRARARGMTGPRADGQTPGGKHFRQGSRSDRPISGHGQGGRKCSRSGFGANVEGTKKAQKALGRSIAVVYVALPDQGLIHRPTKRRSLQWPPAMCSDSLGVVKPGHASPILTHCTVLA